MAGGRAAQASAAARKAVLVDLSVADQTVEATSGIIITVLGTLKVDMAGGGAVTFPSGALAIGVIHRLSVVKVYKVGTSATGIVALS